MVDSKKLIQAQYPVPETPSRQEFVLCFDALAKCINDEGYTFTYDLLKALTLNELKRWHSGELSVMDSIEDGSYFTKLLNPFSF